MALTLVATELFQPAGANLVRSTDVRADGSLGAFDDVDGTIHCDLYGPEGYSGRIDTSGAGIWDLSGDGAVWVMLHCWYRIKTFGAATRTPTIAAVASGSLSVPFGTVYLTSGGKFAVALHDGTEVVSAVDVPVNQWFELKFRASRDGFVSGQVNYQYLIKMRLPGEASWTTVVDYNYDRDFPFINWNKLYVGCDGSGGGSGLMRIGAPRYWTSSLESTDGTDYIDDTVTDPVEERHHWYVAMDGDDDNDGSETRPLLTFSAAEALSEGAGFFDTTLDDTAVAAAETALRAALDADQDDVSTEVTALETAWLAMFENGDGDILHIPDGFRPGPDPLHISTDGMTVENAGTLDCRLVLSSGDWSKTGGYTNLYEITPTGGGMQAAVLWRGETWLPRLDLSNYANEAALLTALDSATAGTWYCNDTKIWITGTNPATDGFTYSRSCFRNAESAITLTGAESMRITGGTITGTCLAEKSGASPGVDYSIGLAGSLSGYCLVDNVTSDKASKHSIGLVVDTQDVAVLMVDTIVKCTSPYELNGGSYSPHVDFAGNGAGFGSELRVYRVRCDCPAIKPTMFSATGTTQGLYAYDCHNNTGPSFTATLWYDCDLGGGRIDEQGAHTEKLHMRDCIIGDITWRAQAGIDVRTTRFSYAPPTADSPAGDNVCLNCLFVLGSTSATAELAEGMTFLGCTFDLTDRVSDYIYNDGGDVTIVAKGCLVIDGTADSWLNGPDVGDTLTLADNVYAATALLAGVNASYVPQTGSAVLDGTDTTAIPELAGTLDYTGVARPASGSLDVGAIEAVLAPTISFATIGPCFIRGAR